MIVVVNYGMGNVGSILNMIKYLRGEAVASADPSVIAQATKVILPGVGAFEMGMERLHELGLVEPLRRRVLEERVPALGICLGLQLMARGSEEGQLAGLGWFDAQVVRFRPQAGPKPVRVPHMGWNRVELRKPSPLVEALPDEPRFYFAHSYHLVAANPADVLCETEHGYRFPSALSAGNVAGVQFHPEKSHTFGMRLLQNFIERC